MGYQQQNFYKAASAENSNKLCDAKPANTTIRNHLSSKQRIPFL